MSKLERLGWTPARQQQLQAIEDPTLVPARVAAEHRGRYDLVGDTDMPGELAGRLRHDAGDRADLPAVGDWVAVRPAEGLAAIHWVLPRTSVLSRKAAGAGHREQIIAANVDVVFIVTSANRDFNQRRIERYLSLVWASGATPVVVINKIDGADDLVALLETLAVIAPGVPAVLTAATRGDGIDELRTHLGTAMTGALVGSSGVGKSTLINALCGEDRLATAAIRDEDAKGRHTTTHRELVELPGGGFLIDTPGMRELGLWDAAEGAETTFADVAALAAQCRFRDCGHAGEPGCAVARAVDSGALAPERLASYAKQLREQAFLERKQDPASQSRAKQRWKNIDQQIRARRKVDPKLKT